ncbi:MAG TPA: phosphodiester glycosidase family protein [Flavisolibacter sp.]|nr:phosphodiester glycosidase family protein [Flavisolibacter sp.]
MKYLIAVTFLFPSFLCIGQLQWNNVDTLFGPLPRSVHVYFTSQAIDTAPFKAYYIVADLKDRKLDFTTDTTLYRRLTPAQFFERNSQPLLVVNGTFFSFETNQNLNVVIKNGEMVSYNSPIRGKGKDSLMYYHSFKSALGISKEREADVAWVYADSSETYPMAFQLPLCMKDIYIPASKKLSYRRAKQFDDCTTDLLTQNFVEKKWKMQTAIGGGPVLVHYDFIKVTNEQERLFTGKAINDKHPRTAMGYTKDNKLIILAIEGRNKEAGGATLLQEAQILKDLSCVEALNLDGGGSSCLLINGKETIRPSDTKGQRPVPAVFMIFQKK